jgi:GATA-binding protein, other eukaryote
VRYRQGRLLPEYRPAASPTFVPSEHASRHREVLQLHRRQQGGSNKQPPRKQQAKPVVDDGRSLLDRCIGAPESDDEDDNNSVFLLRRVQPVKHEYPPTRLHWPQPQPVDDDPRVGGSSGNNGSVPGTDAPGTLDSLLLDGPSAPLIVDRDEFLVS